MWQGFARLTTPRDRYTYAMKSLRVTAFSKPAGSNNYQFRRKIPQDLIPHLSKKEIKKFLSTSERREAEKCSRILISSSGL
jgi:hypothetical protein